MKKLLLILTLISCLSYGQTTIYSENFGSYAANNILPFTTLTFQNQNSTGNCEIHYYGTTNFSVSGGGGSSTYYPSNNVGASGGGSIYLRRSNSEPVRFFQINNINTSSYSDLTLSFNHLVARNQDTFNIRMIVEQSVDGVNWSNLDFNQTINSWYNVSISGIFSSPTLSLRFSRPVCSCANAFGIDDVKIIAQTLSNDDFNKSIVKVYPNPTKDYVTLVSDNQSGLIKLHNIVGQLIYSQPITQLETVIPIKQFGVSGLNLLSIYDDNNKLIQTEKIILQ
jgi:hypothetical protein